MSCRLLMALLVLVSPPLWAGPSKEIVQLQRDVALLDDRVRSLQRSIDEGMGALRALAQRTLDRVNAGNTANAVLQTTFKERLGQQEKSLLAPVASLGAKFDQMSSEFQAVRESISDLTARLKRLDQQIADLDNAVRVIKAPPPPPPAVESQGGPPPGVSAQSLYQSATNDKLSGKLDLALQEFTDYLRYFGDTDLAASSQFYIGEIYYRKRDLLSALEAFDRVLEQYPKSDKAPDALYMKAMTLVKQGRRTRAVQELNKLIRDYPYSDLVSKAKAEVTRLKTPKAVSKR